MTDISLQYELRSFEKSGLLDHVGTVFIISENATDAKLVKARYQNHLSKQVGNNENITQLRVIAMDDVQVPFRVENFKKNVKLAKSHYAPYIPKISEYYLLVPDDIVMLRTSNGGVCKNHT